MTLDTRSLVGLKPCPFCGSYLSEQHNAHAIWCVNCGAHGPHPPPTLDWEVGQNLWNDRPVDEDFIWDLVEPKIAQMIENTILALSERKPDQLILIIPQDDDGAHERREYSLRDLVMKAAEASFRPEELAEHLENLAKQVRQQSPNGG